MHVAIVTLVLTLMELIGGYLCCGRLDFKVAKGFSVHQGRCAADLVVLAAQSVGIELVAPDVSQLTLLPDGKHVTVWGTGYAEEESARRERISSDSTAAGVL
jgi:hypothetical protein